MIKAVKLKVELLSVILFGQAILLAGCQTSLKSNPEMRETLSLDSLQNYSAPSSNEVGRSSGNAQTGNKSPETASANTSSKTEMSDSRSKHADQAGMPSTAQQANAPNQSFNTNPSVQAKHDSANNESGKMVFRGQSGGFTGAQGRSPYQGNYQSQGSYQEGPNGYPQEPVPASGSPVRRASFQDPGGSIAPSNDPNVNGGVPNNSMIPQNATFGDYPYSSPTYPPNAMPPGQGQLGFGQPLITPPGIADLDIFVREGQTGQFMIGAGINSDAGLTGQLTISEKNFDIRKWPRSWRDISSGEAFRGAGQSFRLEAMPGTQVQRYLVSFGEPYFYLFGQPFSFNTSGYYFTRGYFDWDEQRLGGTVSLGYRLTPDVSLSMSARAEDITIFNPRLGTSPDLNRVVGDNELYSMSLGLTHDTRDHPFLSSQGHFMSLTYQQAFGNFDYSRGDFEFRKYWLLTQRPDGSGKQTVSHSTKVGITGSQTPVFENYYAGGFSTMRGFDFRGASPVQNGVITGGEFQFLNTLEYTFPITADDMFKGVLFCDYGTVEESVQITEENFRVVPGFGFRVNMPVGGAGGAPLAFDFGFPVMSAPTDDRRIFSFYMAVLR